MENLNFALTVTIMGMGITFLVLILISLLMAGMNRVWDAMDAKKQGGQAETGKEARETEIEAPPAAQQQKVTAPPVAANTQRTDGIPGSVVAAITATVALMMAESGNSVQITGIRKVGAANSGGFAWSQAGRSEIINTRQRYFERKVLR